jgi:hypothetical protein
MKMSREVMKKANGGRGLATRQNFSIVAKKSVV